ncbi:MAG TPA: hypothetical protein VN493_30835 [Thermoanaerobaculia bacterium]|nr:hypothetical protein [Thermoanaerobaculia bacterium]
MRERFGRWGADLSAEDFSCALATAGVLAPWNIPRGPAPTPEYFASEIRRRTSPSGKALWRYSLPLIPAPILAEAWRLFLESGGRGKLRIEIMGAAIDPRWVVEQLSRPEVGAASVELWVAPKVDEKKEEERERTRRAQSYSVNDEPEDEGYRSAYRYGLESASRSSSRRWKNVESDIQRGYERSRGRGREGLEWDTARDVARKAFEKVMDQRREEAPPRYLQARLQDRTDSRDVPLREGGSYHAVIRIGSKGGRWVSVETRFEAPAEPPEPEGHRLTVIFWEPRVSPDPQLQSLLLPPEGNTDEILFPFDVPEGLDAIAARITVLHNNRVLQTGVLRASVGGEGRWTFTLDATPRTRLEGLSARSQFDLALVLNHDDEGTPRVTVATDDKTVVLKLDDGPVHYLTDFLNAQISAIAVSPERYGNLDSPGTVELLRSLAIMGATIHDRLCKGQRLHRLDKARRIHITSAKAESFFPIELLYSFRPPSQKATLCSHAAAALDSGDCTADCPSDKKNTVCPLGFWGLSRVIERHAHEPEDGERGSGDFELRAEPVRKQSTLPISGTALLAASDRAREKDGNAVTGLLQRLQQRGPAALVNTWAEWEERVASDSPGLLVLLPHHERQGGFDVLEIGDSDQLPSASIWDEQVRRVPDGPSPVVLLIGCATNLTRVSFDNPAGRFHDRGAAVVVSTIATILGRHASPATAMLVELLDQMAAEGNRTLGDVMLRLRQKLVLKQTPMALGLTAYGDADWILTRKEDHAHHRNAPRQLR